MTSASPVPVILLFLKAPVPGKVKTRLAKDTDDKAACGIYCKLVERQVSALPSKWQVEIHFTPTSAHSKFVAWLGSGFTYIPQSDGDLGARLRQATAGAFARGHSPVLLIGGDCPSLDTATMKRTTQHLEKGADVVIGPATDGGYYLLGLSRLADSLFEDIPWSGPEVARITAERAKAAGLRLAWLEQKEDVDDLAAYRRARAAGYLK